MVFGAHREDGRRQRRGTGRAGGAARAERRERAHREGGGDEGIHRTAAGRGARGGMRGCNHIFCFWFANHKLLNENGHFSDQPEPFLSLKSPNTATKSAYVELKSDIVTFFPVSCRCLSEATGSVSLPSLFTETGLGSPRAGAHAPQQPGVGAAHRPARRSAAAKDGRDMCTLDPRPPHPRMPQLRFGTLSSRGRASGGDSGGDDGGGGGGGGGIQWGGPVAARVLIGRCTCRR